MRTIFLLSLTLLASFNVAIAQNSTAPSTTTSVSITPEMSASAVSSLYSVLATSSPQQPGSGPTAGDAGSSAGSSAVDSDAGASGGSSESFSLSRGAIIAIIVVACSICILGAVSAVLFYFAKKRDWQIRESIRKSARRVASALTPRRTTFPKDVQKRKSNKGLSRIDEIPNSPRTRSTDIEKGNPKLEFEMAELDVKPTKQSKWARKFGR